MMYVTQEKLQRPLVLEIRTGCAEGHIRLTIACRKSRAERCPRALARGHDTGCSLFQRENLPSIGKREP